MRLLLDTATIIWIATDESKLTTAALNAYQDRENAVFVSVVSIWEMLVKNRLGILRAVIIGGTPMLL